MSDAIRIADFIPNRYPLDIQPAGEARGAVRMSFAPLELALSDGCNDLMAIAYQAAPPPNDPDAVRWPLTLCVAPESTLRVKLRKLDAAMVLYVHSNCKALFGKQLSVDEVARMQTPCLKRRNGGDESLTVKIHLPGDKHVTRITKGGEDVDADQLQRGERVRVVARTWGMWSTAKGWGLSFSAVSVDMKE
jgi:hypothetical protein